MAHAWDDKTLALKYIKFTNGCVIVDCVETELRSVAKVSDLLSFYGLYRQVMMGDNNTPQPSYIYAEKRLKWNAWTKYNGLTQQQALIKWFKLYNQMLTQFPEVFNKCKYYDLKTYNPIKPFTKDVINNENDNKSNDDDKMQLQLDVKRLQMELQINEEKDNNNQNGIKYIPLKQQQYKDIILYANQLKNKMKKYHTQFEKNKTQIKILQDTIDTNTQTNRNNINKINQISKINSRYKKMFLVIMFIIIAAAITYIYKKRKSMQKK